jgi:hypothetical protein
MTSHRCAVVIIALFLQNAVIAQSLADVAKAEEARRKSVKATTKVYTNEDLGRTTQVNPATSPAAGANAAAKPADAATKPAEEKPADEKPDPSKSEAHWKGRASAIQHSLSRSRLLLDALQSQVNGLNAEFVNTDDPGQRDLLQVRVQRATGELQRVQQDLERQTKAAADFQEEARRAGVPPGWVR